MASCCDNQNRSEGCCSSEKKKPESNNSECCSSKQHDCKCENRITSSDLTACDIVGGWKARWGIGRMNYSVCPGLYQLGNPDKNSHVLVTANYKLTFDRLRSNLKGLDCWILVLDTKGINVWCAAGKGTFGTDELVYRIKKVKLRKKVSHKKLIVPQLGAVGVSAHKVKELSGYKVKFGPVRSEDILEFINNDLKASPEMRKVRFNFWDRIVLIPVEITASLKLALKIMAAFFILSGFGKNGFSHKRMCHNGFRNLFLFSSGYLSGTALTPALLPWLPGKAFAAKGALAGLMTALLFGHLGNKKSLAVNHHFSGNAWTLLITSISSFLGMNFTGSSTYTSLSGVRKEMKVAVPLQILTAALGLILYIFSLFKGDNNEV